MCSSDISQLDSREHTKRMKSRGWVNDKGKDVCYQASTSLYNIVRSDHVIDRVLLVDSVRPIRKAQIITLHSIASSSPSFGREENARTAQYPSQSRRLPFILTKHFLQIKMVVPNIQRPSSELEGVQGIVRYLGPKLSLGTFSTIYPM